MICRHVWRSKDGLGKGEVKFLRKHKSPTVECGLYDICVCQNSSKHILKI